MNPEMASIPRQPSPDTHESIALVALLRPNPYALPAVTTHLWCALIQSARNYAEHIFQDDASSFGSLNELPTGACVV